MKCFLSFSVTSFRLSHQDKIASHKSAQRTLNLYPLLHVELQRQRHRGSNSCKNQMAVLWYLLSWRGQKVKIQLETQRQYGLRDPQHCGLCCLKSSIRHTLNAQINRCMHTYSTICTQIHEFTHKYPHRHTNRFNEMQPRKRFSPEDELVISKLVFRLD